MDTAFNSRGLLPMDGEKITVEHVLVCSAPNSPVLMVVSKDTSGGRVFYTVRVLEASSQHMSGPPTTSLSCIYSTVTCGVRDTGPATAKPPPPPPPHPHGGIERQAVVSLAVNNTSQAVPKEAPAHQQRGIENQTASTPPLPSPHLQERGMEIQELRNTGSAIAKPPPPHLQGGMGIQSDASWPVSITSQAVPKEPPPQLHTSMESRTASTPPPPPPHLQGGIESQKVSTPPPLPQNLQTGTESRTRIAKASPPHPQTDIEDQTVSTSVNQTHRPAASHFDQLMTPSSGAETTSASLQPPGVTSETSVPGKYMDLGGRYLQYVPYEDKVRTAPKA